MYCCLFGWYCIIIYYNVYLGVNIYLKWLIVIFYVEFVRFCCFKFNEIYFVVNVDDIFIILGLKMFVLKLMLILICLWMLCFFKLNRINLFEKLI